MFQLKTEFSVTVAQLQCVKVFITLHFYSPKCYRYVRSIFDHKRTSVSTLDGTTPQKQWSEVLQRCCLMRCVKCTENSALVPQITVSSHLFPFFDCCLDM